MKHNCCLLLLALTAFCTLAVSCSDPEESAASALARRIIPGKASRIEFARTADTSDVFTLSARKGKVVISAPNSNCMAVGLNYYLNNYCDATVSWYAADKVELPAKLPLPEEPLRVEARVPERFFLNYCTFGYSLVWWQWKDWERLIDWMALNGINRPLAITGQEAVWQKVWREMGMTDGQIRAYFTAPPFLPWQRMMNIDRWMGPLPQGWIDSQAKLQKRILARERQLGMKPVLSAFSGHIPVDMKDILPEGSDIRPVSLWDGFGEECRTYMLHPDDPAFAKIQKLYLDGQKALYGTDHIYGLDIFNEVDFFESGPWDPEELSRISHHVYETLAAADPDAIWLQMGWMMYYDRAHWTPEIIKAYLGSVPQGKVIMLDYFIEKSMIWEYTEGFYGQPYYLCFLGNFGGNTLLEGNFDDLGPRLEKALEASPAGIGCTLEGFGISPFLYEYTLSKAWSVPETDAQWVEKLADRRSGRGNEKVREAWNLLCHEVYTKPAVSSVNSLMCRRPSFDADHYAPTRGYDFCDPKTLEKVFTLLVESGCKGEDIRFDLVAIGTKVMENRFEYCFKLFKSAYEDRDPQAMKLAWDIADVFMDSVEQLLATDDRYSLKQWIDGARAMGRTAEEKDYYERSARMLLASWGGAGQLTDYAGRQWSGLFYNYYKARWDLFAAAAIEAVEQGVEFDQKAFDLRVREFELAFGNSTEPLLEPAMTLGADTYEICSKLLINE